MNISRTFFDLELGCAGAVFAPRFETEAMIAQLLDFVQDNLKGQKLQIADFGTGSGAIAASLASFLPEAHIDAYEKSVPAYEVARENFAALELSNVRLLNRSWQQAAGDYDLIVCNPPYVTRACTSRLLDSRQLADPSLALDGGVDGLAASREVIGIARKLLRQPGYLVLEHGLGQHYELVEELRQASFAIAGWGRDLQGLKRFIIAKTA